MKLCLKELDLLCVFPRDLEGAGGEAAVAGATSRDDLTSHRSQITAGHISSGRGNLGLFWKQPAQSLSAALAGCGLVFIFFVF